MYHVKLVTVVLLMTTTNLLVLYTQPGYGQSAVNIKLHYESLCPYSKQFVVDQLIPTYTKLAQIIDLHLVPFGNAKWNKFLRSDGDFDVDFTCQHGTNECIGNKIHDCVLPTVSIDRSLKLFECMFNDNNWKDTTAAGKKCADQLSFNWTTINECTTGPYGRGLHLVHGEDRQNEIPKPNYVPWVIVNGVHNDNIQEQAQNNLLKLVCDTYQGTKPEQCKQGL